MSTAFQINQNGEYLVCKNQDVIYNGVYLFTNWGESGINYCTVSSCNRKEWLINWLSWRIRYEDTAPGSGKASFIQQ